ncbi:deoxyribodipyrimidine photo-lyase [Brochothrix campestris FSL F6-1037]|uniref:Deoxyribodipyrimidine photo-lyase n=1 Tax=Brochothrix campestris FSL F6-1037 TaxID=1265861 RepID=W7CQ69_9LIST|nr:deoxyribodipyrimidine photo-lyase [Brochothrix campestris FSL F6-1037]
MLKPMIHIVLFRNDLRLDHQPALQAALDARETHDQIVLLFHLNPSQFAPKTARHDYFFKTLNWFQTECQQIAPLHFIAGELSAAFTSLLATLGTNVTFYFNRQLSGERLRRDQQLIALLEDKQIPYQQFLDGHLHGVAEVKKADGSSYRVFTPYYRQWLALEKPSWHRIRCEQSCSPQYEGACFDEGRRVFAGLLTQLRAQQWDETIGVTAARQQLEQFIAGPLATYDYDRDFPARAGTSRMSPYLKYGVLSIVEVYRRVVTSEQRGQATYIKELAWRDFYQMIACENPTIQTEALTPQYRALEWEVNPAGFNAWCKGETGYPLVDAAMKQLNATGWMHNRLRMVVSSFLVKDLGIDWREGERYFAEKLIDYDRASNAGGWQWAASTGVDAVPYFRVFNPTVQSKRFDPDGAFIRRWLPELVLAKSKEIHEPQKYGLTYLAPIVDHQTARLAAIERFKRIKNKTDG